MLLVYALYALVPLGVPAAAFLLVRALSRRRPPAHTTAATAGQLREAQVRVADLTIENARLENEQRFTRELLTPRRRP